MPNQIARPPIVTILGHVDHGKTSLLDFIRQSRIAAKEHGGITQKIGAYEIATGIKGYHTNKITFIDTPGHEAFSKLRARGANVADIAILIIDAKDSVMPQTAESISHIKSAKIPFIVALNKVDLSEANPEKVKKDLLKYEVQVEGMGGGIPVVSLSAKTGKGVPELLESILLIASDLNLKYTKEDPAKAIIIETKKNRRGVVVSAVIKDGGLKVGDFIVTEGKKAKIRSLTSDLGKPLSMVEPSTPFELLGFDDMPEVGSVISLQSEFAKQTIPVSPPSPAATISQTVDLDALLNPKKEEQKLALVVKADSQGSLEAINQTLSTNPHIDVVLSGVGDVHKSDIFLAKSTKAIIVGFSVDVSDEAQQLAKQEKVIIKNYTIIYHLLEELTEVTDLLQEKKQQEKSLKGSAKILANFLIEGERVAGVKVTKGKINLGDSLELYREDNLIGKTKLVSLKVRAKPVQEVKKDQEAGMILSPPLDFRVGDVVKCIL